ncbi:MAG: DNA alkylation repair protein [Chloroflexi bacterium]|nr:DNA alkylation repair protein [Chloroflexota bacterium]MCC6895359.1 DNA alkylation repair protein [Anaerolineae bacterium]
MQVKDVLAELERLGDPKVKAIKAGFAITAENSHGIFLKDIKALAKRIGRNDALALELFDTGVYEARVLCSKIFTPRNVTEALMETWSATFENWEICDTFCMGFLGTTRFAVPKAFEWAERKGEFQKRAGFVLMVAHSFTDKHTTNDVYQKFFPVMVAHANDERTYVMKGINWALRQVGKRNADLYREALEVAQTILALDTKTARWIAKDAIRQLQSPTVSIKNYPRAIYGK